MDNPNRVLHTIILLVQPMVNHTFQSCMGLSRQLFTASPLAQTAVCLSTGRFTGLHICTVHGTYPCALISAIMQHFPVDCMSQDLRRRLQAATKCVMYRSITKTSNLQKQDDSYWPTKSFMKDAATLTREVAYHRHCLHGHHRCKPGHPGPPCQSPFALSARALWKRPAP